MWTCRYTSWPNGSLSDNRAWSAMQCSRSSWFSSAVEHLRAAYAHERRDPTTDESLCRRERAHMRSGRAAAFRRTRCRSRGRVPSVHLESRNPARALRLGSEHVGGCSHRGGGRALSARGVRDRDARRRATPRSHRVGRDGAAGPCRRRRLQQFSQVSSSGVEQCPNY